MLSHSVNPVLWESKGLLQGFLFEDSLAWLFSNARLYRTGMASFHAKYLCPQFVPELTVRSAFVFKVSTSFPLAWVSAHYRCGRIPRIHQGYNRSLPGSSVFALLSHGVSWSWPHLLLSPVCILCICRTCVCQGYLQPVTVIWGFSVSS